MTRSFVKVGYMNTEWNFLISPVMLCAHCVSFERHISQPESVLVHLGLVEYSYRMTQPLINHLID